MLLETFPLLLKRAVLAGERVFGAEAKSSNTQTCRVPIILFVALKVLVILIGTSSSNSFFVPEAHAKPFVNLTLSASPVESKHPESSARARSRAIAGRYMPNQGIALTLVAQSKRQARVTELLLGQISAGGWQLKIRGLPTISAVNRVARTRIRNRHCAAGGRTPARTASVQAPCRQLREPRHSRSHWKIFTCVQSLTSDSRRSFSACMCRYEMPFAPDGCAF